MSAVVTAVAIRTRRAAADPGRAARLLRDPVEAASGVPGWRIRAGIRIGPVAGGIAGRTRFTFDLWGDPANVAARLSQGHRFRESFS
jgi:adenylate cyclase